MRIAIRTDASVEIGSGHLIRCLTLADQLRGEGAEVVFICCDLPGGMFGLLRTRGYRFAKLPLAESGAGVQQFDAEETIKAVGQLLLGDIDWLVVDHYGLDVVWERMLRSHVCKLMVIDDLANRQHECDLLLDQNYESAERYKYLVTKNCRLLLGPHFALLRPEYAAYRKSMKPRIEELRRVLVFFGGTDQHNMTGLSLKVLSQSEFRHLDVDVVVGANYEHHEDIGNQAAKRPKTIIYGPRLHLADLMAQADIAIGAGGVTNWERMCLGLPSLVVTIAENQIPISKLLDAEGAIRLVGSSGGLTAEDIRNALIDEIEMYRYLRRTKIAIKKCDGLGVSRVIDAIKNAD
jgi:UDP-2,4-diacetamido-2,4,6-trideoxy-beta-L-altropyranose hydrolase